MKIKGNITFIYKTSNDAKLVFDSLEVDNENYLTSTLDHDSINYEINSEKSDEMNWEHSAGSQWNGGEQEGLLVYICSSCGGEIVGDNTLGATHCPYCDNPVILKGQFSDALRPDLVIPFKLDKKAAVAALKKHYMGKRLLPKVFKDENHIEEVKGVYVPFWLFDADASADARYKATKLRVWSDSNYNYTETSYFSIHRGGTLGFSRVPVDGSTKMDDALMESIEPFRIEDAVDFNTAYLSGYLADKYDVDSAMSISRANERIKKSAEDAFRATVRGYSSVITENCSIALTNGSSKYALFPVWLLNTVWNGQRYTFAMNGQTGKLVGDLPLDKSAYKRWLFGIFAGVGAAVFLLQFLFWLI